MRVIIKEKTVTVQNLRARCYLYNIFITVKLSRLPSICVFASPRSRDQVFSVSIGWLVTPCRDYGKQLYLPRL